MVHSTSLRELQSAERAGELQVKVIHAAVESTQTRDSLVIRATRTATAVS